MKKKETMILAAPKHKYVPRFYSKKILGYYKEKRIDISELTTVEKRNFIIIYDK